MRMHPHHHRLPAVLNAAFHISIHQRNMRLAAIHFALIRDHAKLAMRRRQQRLRHTMDVPLIL